MPSSEGKAPLMRVDILTLFPDSMKGVLGESILGRAAAKDILEINCIQIREFTENKQCQVDDYPYGGGWGCVMMAQPLKSCLDHVRESAGDRRTRVIYMSPQGTTFTQAKARQLCEDYDHLILVCGHYEGVDERFIEACVDEEISMGDYVLTGGEIAAMALTDSVCRLVPGVLADEECYTGESHWDGLLEYPQYTRPEVWEGRPVPKALTTGNHGEIARWRRKKQLERTRDKRPDLFEKFIPRDKTDSLLLEELKKDKDRAVLTLPVKCRRASMQDIPTIMELIKDARRLMGSRNIDQWQGTYPNQEVFEEDISRGECFLMCHGEDIAGVFTLSAIPDEGYNTITDGKWSSDEPYTVIHRSTVAKAYRGTGVSDLLMEEAEKLSFEMGFRWIRVDTHRKNKAMQKLLRRQGYHYRGNVLVDAEPGHDPRRVAYEKKIKARRC